MVKNNSLTHTLRRNIFVSREKPDKVSFEFTTSTTHRILNNKLVKVQPSLDFRPAEIVLDAGKPLMNLS